MNRFKIYLSLTILGASIFAYNFIFNKLSFINYKIKLNGVGNQPEKLKEAIKEILSYTVIGLDDGQESLQMMVESIMEKLNNKETVTIIQYIARANDYETKSKAENVEKYLNYYGGQGVILEKINTGSIFEF